MLFSPGSACCNCGCCPGTKPTTWTVVIDGLEAIGDCACQYVANRNGTYVLSSLTECTWKYTFDLHDNICCHLTIEDRDSILLKVEPYQDGVKVTVTATFYWKTAVVTPDGVIYVCAAYDLVWSKYFNTHNCQLIDQALDFQNEGFNCGTPTCVVTPA